MDFCLAETYKTAANMLNVGLGTFERRLEHLVEGAFARVFKSGLKPVEIGRRIVREINNNQRLEPTGQTIVPNHFWVFVSAKDYKRLSEIETELISELRDAATAHINEENFSAYGPIGVSLVEAPEYPEGRMQVQAQWYQPPQEAVVTLEDGTSISVGDHPFSIGRLPTSGLTLNDETVSRTHAVIRRVAQGWILTDTGSTNGTFLNGTPISESQISSGDQMRFGAVKVSFKIL